MTSCPWCIKGNVILVRDAFGEPERQCLACSRYIDSPPRAPRPDELPVKGKGVARMVYEASEPHTGRWWTEGDAA